MRQFAISFFLSVAASLLGTYLLRKALSASSGAGEGGGRPPSNDVVVVVIPVMVGNSGNRFLSPSVDRSILFRRKRK